MKKYMAANQLRLVGKAWEIRYQLRKWSNATKDTKLTLKQMLPESK